MVKNEKRRMRGEGGMEEGKKRKEKRKEKKKKKEDQETMLVRRVRPEN